MSENYTQAQLRERLDYYRNFATACLARYKANPAYAEEVLHSKDFYEELLRDCDLAQAALLQRDAEQRLQALEEVEDFYNTDASPGSAKFESWLEEHIDALREKVGHDQRTDDTYE